MIPKKDTLCNHHEKRTVVVVIVVVVIRENISLWVVHLIGNIFTSQVGGIRALQSKETVNNDIDLREREVFRKGRRKDV